jgi:hypothetical protein
MKQLWQIAQDTFIASRSWSGTTDILIATHEARKEAAEACEQKLAQRLRRKVVIADWYVESKAGEIFRAEGVSADDIEQHYKPQYSVVQIPYTSRKVLV